MTIFKRLLILIPILWLGFVLSISFMEAWLKFQAEGVTQVIGLSIGRLVFSVLNKVEVFFLLVLLISGIVERKLFRTKFLKRIFIWLSVILALQSFHLLPYLDERAELIINGESPSSSYFHVFYVFFEIIKVIILAVFIHCIIGKFEIDKKWIKNLESKKPKYNFKNKFK